METKKYLKIMLLALAIFPIAALAQEVKPATRPLRIQTSARPSETAVLKQKGGKEEKVVGKPAANDKRNTAQKSVAAKKKETGKAPTHRYVAIKNNLAYQAVAVMNLAVEVQCTEHLSVELPLMWSFWDMEQEHGIRTFALQPEVRWWMAGKPGSGHFFGLHAHAAWFNVKWNDSRYQSNSRPLLGAGVSYGYMLPLGEHWGTEFTLGAGYANMKYDTYYNIDNGAKIDTRVRNYWGITRLGLSLVYRF